MRGTRSPHRSIRRPLTQPLPRTRGRGAEHWRCRPIPDASALHAGQRCRPSDRGKGPARQSLAGGGADAADGYTLVRKLGTGSFGTVWEAEDRLTGERVAIKFFTAGDADWAKLLGEVGLLQAVEGCRGIVMVKQVRTGGPGHRPHYVMQLANGGSLADWLKTAAELPT